MTRACSRSSPSTNRIGKGEEEEEELGEREKEEREEEGNDEAKK
jgi:hypothetical protein